MADTANRFEAASNDLTAMLKGLMDHLSTLSTTWKGLAAGEFTKVKIQYEQDLTQLNRALAETAEGIRSSGKSYTLSDTDAASRLSQSGGGGVKLPL